MLRPRKYRKKPVVVEALEWTGENVEEMEKFLGCELMDEGDGIGYLVEYQQQMHLMIRTLEGDHRANVGDYIIKGLKGEFYPCKPDIFGATYDIEEELKGNDMLVSMTIGSTDVITTNTLVHHNAFPENYYGSAIFQQTFTALKNNKEKYQCHYQLQVNRVRNEMA